MYANFKTEMLHTGIKSALFIKVIIQIFVKDNILPVENGSFNSLRLEKLKS